MFPEYLPDGGLQFRSAPDRRFAWRDGYASFGFLMEPVSDLNAPPLPIGFSQRRVLVDRVGLNCALCHTSTVRIVKGMNIPEVYPQHKPQVIERRSMEPHGVPTESLLIYGMPANTVDLEAYFTFLFRCAEDSRFTTEGIMQAVRRSAEEEGNPLAKTDDLILTRAVPLLKETLRLRRHQLNYLSLLPHSPGEPVSLRFGPGRVDTFNPYKSIQFGFPYDGTYGIADYPSIWNQRPREGMQLHWDGNNRSVFERNISASLGAGATPVSLDFDRILRVAAWIGAPPMVPSSEEPESLIDRSRPYPAAGQMPIPNYPFAIDRTLAARGAGLYAKRCATCHDWDGSQIGTVEPIASIGTDSARLDSYTEALQSNQNLLGADHWWRFKNFRKTNGYANGPLDGIWARAPYLHNGSVPTLLDLFRKPCNEDDLHELGLNSETDLVALATSPSRVSKLIQNARDQGLRPPLFFRGDDEYDPVNGGFRCDRPYSVDGRKLYLFSTIEIRSDGVRTLLGNGHQGHYGERFGTELNEGERQAVVEYQKTFGQPSP
ncbi:c-type cytochrome [Planctomyces sp. SH-PL14]|uniref:c-type cytochrome n=1 Tax=Planctomyces sp. SH-PL14 TaxID=1632864 RepID=UPI0012E7B749|nr:c-type cytochrome [Planctomyces sp. SH-PL14]